MGVGLNSVIIAGVIAAGTVLTRAGTLHAWNPAPMAGTLSPGPQPRWVSAAVRIWGLSEVVLGAGLVVALLQPGPAAAGLAAATSAMLMGYTLWLAGRRRSSQPWCACTGGQTPINLATVLRPLAMALPAAGLALNAGGGRSSLDGIAAVDLTGGIIAGLGLGFIAWYFPEAITKMTDLQRIGGEA